VNIRTLIKGGKKYARALAAGDRATPCDRMQRHATCRDCPSMQTIAVPKMCGAKFQTCGEFAQETRSTCGCIVGVTYRGRELPAGKVRVGSERCPQGRW
jgi:hypothetical protein